jgi:hypothetical protein
MDPGGNRTYDYILKVVIHEIVADDYRRLNAIGQLQVVVIQQFYHIDHPVFPPFNILWAANNHGYLSAYATFLLYHNIIGYEKPPLFCPPAGPQNPVFLVY